MLEHGSQGIAENKNGLAVSISRLSVKSVEQTPKLYRRCTHKNELLFTNFANRLPSLFTLHFLRRFIAFDQSTEFDQEKATNRKMLKEPRAHDVCGHFGKDASLLLALRGIVVGPRRGVAIVVVVRVVEAVVRATCPTATGRVRISVLTVRLFLRSD